MGFALRGTVSRLLPVVCAAGLVGCVWADAIRRDGIVDSPAAPKADREKTLAYWISMKRIVERTGPSAEPPAVSSLGRQKAQEIRALPTAGVDTELVERTQAAALHLDHFSALIASNPTTPNPSLEATSRQMMDANARLAAMRTTLAARYKSTFPPLPLVGCPGG